MGQSAWFTNVNAPPLPLFENNTIIEQPVDLSTLTARYSKQAISFIENATNKNQSWVLYLAFSHVQLKICKKNLFHPI